MKRVYDFIYCDGILNAATVFFRVKVGTSQRDKTAHAKVQTLASSNNSIFYQIHSQQVQEFEEKVARSFFPTIPDPFLLLRVKYVEIVWLERFLRQNPPQLLNSDRVETLTTAETIIASGWKSRAEIQLQKSKSLKKTDCHPEK